MRIACVAIPSFAVAIERLRAAGLGCQPVIVYDRSAVVDASPEAEPCRAGLAQRQAKALYPQATFIQADHACYRAVFESMLDALEEITPLVEASSMQGCAFADIGGLAGHYRDELELAGAVVDAVRDATGLLASIGIADGKFVAWVAASEVVPGDAGIVRPGCEREFVADKDVSLLPFDAAITERLHMLALHSLGEIAALQRTAVEAQFRSRGARMWDLANGIDLEPLRPRKHQEFIEERVTFPSAVVASEALVAAGRQIVTRFARRLRGRTARRMHTQFFSEGQIVWERLETFREPTGDERRMLLVLKTRLTLLELPQGIDTVAVTLSGLGNEVAKQTKLFSDTQQNMNQIAEAIRQLRARYGRPVVWRITEVDPWSRHPEERSALVPYDA
jgi:nucleotidyltransferase/DNA polymerase involved in DNA repair